MTRTYTEDYGNGVIAETIIINNGVDDCEIRYVVKKGGCVIFNQALTGRYAYQQAVSLARQQDALASASTKG